MFVKIVSPYKNLGCLGFFFGNWYVDFFKAPYWGMFASVATKKIRIGIILRYYMVAVLFKVEHAFRNPTRFYWGRITK